MWHALLTTLLLCTADAPATGAVVYLENSNAIVEKVTDSKISHVGILFRQEDSVWIYEATPGFVRRISLDAYRKEIATLNRGRKEPMKLFLLEPSRPYSDDECAALLKHLESELGRRYSIKGYVRNEPVEGVHCAELVCASLQATGRHAFERKQRTSPVMLVTQLRGDSRPPERLSLPKLPEISRCQQAWERWTRFSAWCSWSCYESWMFCR